MSSEKVEPRNASGVLSPIGISAEAASEKRAARSAVYRAQQEKYAPFREVAWLIIKYRMDHGLTQQQLAQKIGTSYSQVSRIESGRHEASLSTLRRIAEALDLRLLISFESKSEQSPTREFAPV